MASTKGITLDKVMIEIESDSSNADKNIESLSETLGKLKNNTKGGFASISRLAEHINNLKKSTDNLGNIENKLASVNGVIETLNKLSEIKSPKSIGYLNRSLTELNESSSYIDNISKNFQNIEPLVSSFQSLSSIETASGLGYAIKQLGELSNVSGNIENLVEKSQRLPELVEPLQSLSNIKTPRALGYIVNNIENLERVLASITPTTLENVTRVSNELTRALDPLAEKMASIGQGYSALSQLARTYGVQISNLRDRHSATNKEMTKAKRILHTLQDALQKNTTTISRLGKTGSKIFTSLNSKIKQVYLSLLGTRTLFTMVRKAISEYSQMDAELTKQTTNLWRALGAQLAPALEAALYLFKQFTRVIYSFVYAVTGIDLIARANAKAMASWGSSAKDTLGALQKFDDLNVAEFGSGDSDNSLIELDKIDLSPIQKVIDWVKKLKEAIKEAWSTGAWNGVAQLLADGINGAVDSIDGEAVGNAISNGLIGVVDFIDTLISGINWRKLGLKVREIILGIDWKSVGSSIWKLIQDGFNAQANIINGLFGLEEDNNFGENLLWTFLGIWGAVKLIKGIDGLGGILETLGVISESPSLGVILTKLGGIAVIALGIKSTFDSWQDFIKDPNWSTGWDTVYDTLLGVAAIVGGIALLIGAWPVALIAAGAMIVLLIGKFLTENLDAINEWCANAMRDVLDWISKTWTSITIWWMGVKIKISNAFSALGDTIGGAIASAFTWALNRLIDGFNWIKKQLNKFSFDIPEWVPQWGGQTWGFDFEMTDYIKLATGTNEIQSEGLYHLHEGEAVVPKKYNPALGNGTDAELGQKLDTLIDIMNNMNFTNVVNIGNKTLYKQQEKYNRKQNDKYGTTVNI